MIRKTLLPNLNLLHLPQRIRISTFDKLHNPLQRDFRRRRKQQMNMVRHNNKFVQQIFPLIAIPEQHLDQKPSPRLDTKDGQALPRNGCDEKRTL